jgi:hypothetical protein
VTENVAYLVLSALFITGSADSAVFFHEMKEYGDGFYIVE